MDKRTNPGNSAPKTRGSGTFKLLLWAIAVTVLIAIFRSIGTGEGNPIPARIEPTPPPPAPPPAREVIRTTSYDLNRRYEANEVAVDEQIGNAKIQVTGIVESITKNFLDEAIIGLNGDTRIYLKDDQKGAAANLHKGDITTVLCERMRRIMSSPVGTDCVFTTQQ